MVELTEQQKVIQELIYTLRCVHSCLDVIRCVSEDSGAVVLAKESMGWIEASVKEAEEKTGICAPMQRTF